MKKEIQIVPYNIMWPTMFAEEASLIKKALKENVVEIHHIGSTSVLNLAAKPIIDILPVVRDIQKVDRENKALESLGYEVKGEYGIAFRRFFKKEGYNVHVYQENDPEISRYLKFRDWLRSHPEDATIYAKLKKELAERFPDEILAYCNGKDAFVANIDAKTGFDGYRVVQALTTREWNKVKDLRQYFFKLNEDPFTWTFEHQDHIHFVFYLKTEIIGYLHLQLWPGQRAALRIIVLEEPYRGLSFGSQFLKLCERWLLHQGFSSLHVQSHPTALKFYRKNGYIPMAFNDPEGHPTHPQDSEIGKFLI